MASFFPVAIFDAVSHKAIFWLNQDGWRQKAILALSRMEQGIAADKSFSIHR